MNQSHCELNRKMNHQFASFSSDIIKHIFLFVRDFKSVLYFSYTCIYIKNLCKNIIDQYMSEPVHIEYIPGFMKPSYFWFKIGGGQYSFITTRKQILNKIVHFSSNVDSKCKYSLEERRKIFCNKTDSVKKNVMIRSCSVCHQHQDDGLMDDNTHWFMLNEDLL